MHGHPLRLLLDLRFWPLFWAQFLGAFNDNALKNALVLMIVYQGLSVWGMDGTAMATFAPALLILPYFLFSSIAGQLADKYPKSMLIQRLKLAELALMILAAAGFYLGSATLLLAVLFLIGTQATFFSPMKYAGLPQYLKEEELVAGNALVEGGTNLSILLGSIVGGLLIALKAPIPGAWLVGLVLVAFAFIGWLCSLRLVVVPAQAPALRMDWNPITTTWRMCANTTKQRGIWNSILGISWFWVFGFAFLALFIPWVKTVLHADEHVVTFFLALFSIGVGVGALACERLSMGKLELGLVPLGSIGMSIFAVDLALASGPATAGLAPGGPLMGLGAFLQRPASWRIVFDLLCMAASAGCFIVPLYTCVQAWAAPEERSRIIAVNNVINALFMVMYAALQMLLLAYLSVPHIFLVIALLNAAIAIHIYRLIPEFTLRFLAYLLTWVSYRLKVHGLANVPDEGPALLVCNHVSFVDWLFISGAVRRPVRFVMHASFAKHPIMKALVADAKIIPIASAKEDPNALQAAMAQIATELQAGEVVCIFPEGKLTDTGEMNEFRPGVERILATTPVPVVPMALRGLWGSFFSRQDRQAFKKPFRRGFWSRVELMIGAAIPPSQATALSLQENVAALRGGAP